MLYPKMNQYRELITLDGFWDFCKDKEAKGIENRWFEQIPKGREIAVPASINEQSSDLMDYFGMCWFEKDLYLPKSFKERNTYLRFGSVTGKCTVWVNSNKVVSHEGAHLPFECEISEYLIDGENKIVVLSDNRLDSWALPPAAMVSKEGREGFFVTYPAVTYDFFPYSGIHRSVYLYTTSERRIEDITIKTTVDGDRAKVEYKVEVSKGTKGIISVRLDNQDWKREIKTEDSGVCGYIEMLNPRLWDIGQPNLYQMKVRLEMDNEVVDEYIQTFGIRSIKVEGNKLLLNGKKIYLRGFGKHEDFHVLGKGFHPSLVVKDFALMDWIGANSFRTSHYPYDENVLDYADRHGILVIDETPLVGLNQRMYTDEILEKSKGLIQDLIRRDKNHPSVIMWSMANEPNANAKEADDFFCELQKFTKECDDTRPITYVAYNEPEDNRALQYCDVVCINKYFGWYVTPGQPDVALEQFSECLDKYYEAFHKPIIVAEFGADAIAGMHFEPARVFTEEYQSEILEKQCELIESKEYTVGTHVWTFADFMVGQSYTRVLFNRKGVFTRERQPKLAAHTLRRIWKEK